VVDQAVDGGERHGLVTEHSGMLQFLIGP
jgi:hypothetical protein